jgi:hypothetical protein
MRSILILLPALWIGSDALAVSASVSAFSSEAMAAVAESGGMGLPPSIGSSFDDIEIVDDSLGSKLTILRIGSQPGSNNLLSVFATLRNTTARRLYLEVETVYKDKAGLPLNDASWIPLTLQPHEEGTYRSSSISEQADDFLVRIRRARPTAAGHK